MSEKKCIAEGYCWRFRWIGCHRCGKKVTQAQMDALTGARD